MQKQKFSRGIILLTVLVLCIGFCTVPVFASEAETTETAETVPAFVLAFDTEDGVVYHSAFCLRSGDGIYLISTAEAGTMAQTGCDVMLLGIDYAEEAQLLKTVGQISYFRAPGMENVAEYELCAEFPDTVVIAVLQEEEDTRYVGTTDPIDMNTGWQNLGSYYLSEDTLVEDTYLLGAPVLTADGTQVVGIVARNNDRVMVILPLGTNVFPADATVTSQPAADPQPGNTEPQETGEGEQEGQGGEEEKKIPVSTLLLIGGGVLVLVGIIVAANKKPKKKEETAAFNPPPAAENYDDFSGATISLQRNEMVSELVDIQSTAPLRHNVVPAPAKWQLRCVRGPLEGKVFPLSGRLSIGRAPENDIVFPGDTRGVSGNHCEVLLSGTNVILQDLNSTYGTYFGMEKHAKLKPNMDYPLSGGDVFILAEGGPAFCLEEIGGNGKKPGFAVRSNSGTLYRSNGDGEITFGRNPECVVTFDHSSNAVSGKHCKLFMKEDGMFLMDQGSTNGTYFTENQRLKPNVSYKVAKGASFFLVNPQNTFVITED